uniref:Uncharacterized protein n=1 Tax=Rhizophora mucronata TaxID=61149 RepID=A0A2P2JZT1_RHIMU
MESSNDHDLPRFHDLGDGSVQQEVDCPFPANWWSNSSSREAWLQEDSNMADGYRQATFHSQQESRHQVECMQESNATRLTSYLGPSLDYNSPNPSLEFTLGRPDWQGRQHK